MNISVFGLGYVGVVNIACLSKLGHTLYGCDIKPHKVAEINSGKSPIHEPQVDELLGDGFKDGRIIASQDAALVVENTEMALVCVGTPSSPEGYVNLSYCINTVMEIADHVKRLNKKYTLVFRSTIPPGTVEDKLMPEVDRILGKNNDLMEILFLPEFLREGSAVKDFFECRRIVIGCNDDTQKNAAIEEVFNFSEEVPLKYVNFRTAEFIKYADNAYHATKVAFANEIYSLGAKFGVDVKKANEIFLMDDILNVSANYLKPGLPYGGSCLPKEVRAIGNLGRIVDMEVPFFKGMYESNVQHQSRLHEKVMSYGKKKILIHGLTFKHDTDDVRESPLLFLSKSLLNENVEIKIYDPNLNIGSMRIENADVVRYVESDETALIEWADLVVTSRRNPESLVDKTNDNQDILNLTNYNDHTNLSPRIKNLYQ
ncbi:MAG: GDP-mannose 6-dehydrogenase [Patiriisocius sp.]|jgi:GDP-mannose 6-dehydrogenase